MSATHGMFGPAQALGAKGGPAIGMPGFGSQTTVSTHHNGLQAMGGQFGWGQPTMASLSGQAMSSMGSMVRQHLGPHAMGGQFGRGHGNVSLGGLNGNIPCRSIKLEAGPGKHQQYISTKRPASGCGGHGAGMSTKRRFAAQCHSHGQIPASVKLEVLHAIYPEVWNPVAATSKTTMDMDSSLAIGFDIWPGSPVGTRVVPGLISMRTLVFICWC